MYDEEPDYVDCNEPNEKIKYRTEMPGFPSKDEWWRTKIISMENDARKVTLYECYNFNHLLSKDRIYLIQYKVVIENKRSKRKVEFDMNLDSTNNLKDFLED
jgi:hypothetical protein